MRDSVSQHVVHSVVCTKDTTMLHERQAFDVVHGRWHSLHNGVAVPNEKRVLSKSVPWHQRNITGVESALFIWYTRHLRSRHVVTYIVKVHA